MEIGIFNVLGVTASILTILLALYKFNNARNELVIYKKAMDDRNKDVKELQTIVSHNISTLNEIERRVSQISMEYEGLENLYKLQVKMFEENQKYIAQQIKNIIENNRKV